MNEFLITISYTFTGSFLGGLFRTVVPIVKKGSTALGQELLKAGFGAAEDIWKTGDIKYTQKKRGKEFINNISHRLSDHMFGSGYSPQLTLLKPQLKPTSRKRRTTKVTKRKVTKRKPTKAKKKTTKKRKTTTTKKSTTTRRRNRTKQDLIDIFSNNGLHQFA